MTADGAATAASPADAPAPAPSTAPLLELTAIRAGYGDFQALFDISLEVRAGEIVTLIGANGAGKTTTLRVISGAVRATSGTVRFDGHDVTGLPAHAMPERGISHVPEARQLFPFMTVEENLDLGAYNQRSRPRARETLGEMLELFPRLKERRRQLAGTLSGGEQQMVAIARALMAQPRLLLLDEPSLGLAPVVVDEVFDALVRIGAQGVSILLVEQDVERALGLATRAYLLVEGRVAAQGSSAELRHSDAVRAAVLGT